MVKVPLRRPLQRREREGGRTVRERDRRESGHGQLFPLGTCQLKVQQLTSIGAPDRRR